MKKIPVLALAKSPRHNYYAFPKQQGFFALARELLKALGFEKYVWDAFGRPQYKDYGEPIYGKEEDIKKYTDERFGFAKGNNHVDIVFGDNKVFLIVSTKEDKQEEIARIVNSFMKN